MFNISITGFPLRLSKAQCHATQVSLVVLVIFGRLSSFVVDFVGMVIRNGSCFISLRGERLFDCSISPATQ